MPLFPPMPPDNADSITLAVQAGGLFLADSILPVEETGKAILYFLAGLAFLATLVGKLLDIRRAMGGGTASTPRRGRRAAAEETDPGAPVTRGEVTLLRQNVTELRTELGAMAQTLSRSMADLQRAVGRLEGHHKE